MKITNLFLASALSVAALLTPVKKAEAGLIIGSTPVFLTAWVVGVAVGLPAYFRQEAGLYGKFDQVAPGIFMAAWAVGILNGEEEGLSAELEKKFPSIPKYVLDEAAFSLTSKAAVIPFNADGVKAAHMTEAEFSDLEAAIPSDADAAQVDAFRTLMTTAVEL